MCETTSEETNMFDNDVCDLLDATMGVVADFASMLANGIYQFTYFHFVCFPFLFILLLEWLLLLALIFQVFKY